MRQVVGSADKPNIQSGGEPDDATTNTSHVIWKGLRVVEVEMRKGMWRVMVELDPTSSQKRRRD